MRGPIACCIALSLMSLEVLPAEQCASDLASFLPRFEDEPAFQRQHTRFPLLATHVDASALPEQKVVKYKIISASDFQYSRISYPSKAEQSAVPFEKKTKPSQSKVLVQFTKPDTDYAFAFVFEKTASCWQLVKFEDYSL